VGTRRVGVAWLAEPGEQQVDAAGLGLGAGGRRGELVFEPVGPLGLPAGLRLGRGHDLA
jgi:hypothetical protein